MATQEPSDHFDRFAEMNTKASNKMLDQIESAEYVLRLLPRQQERDFESRMSAQPAIEGYVAEWVQHFAPLNGEIKPVQPPAQLRSKLMTDLFGDDPKPIPFWQTAAPWRSLSFALAFVAALMAGGLLIKTFVGGGGGNGISGPLYVSEITSRQNDIRLLALYEAESGTLRLSQTTAPVDPERTLQIWAIQGDLDPVSLGFVPQNAKSSVTLPAQMRSDVTGLIFAISEEADGGSSSGKPSGDILAAGRLTGL